MSSVLSGESPGAVAAHSSPQTSPSTMTGTPSSELRPPLRSHSAMNGTSFGSSAHDRYGSPFSRSVSTAGKCSNGYSSSAGKRTSPSASVPTLTSTCRVERSKSARAIETADAPSAARASSAAISRVCIRSSAAATARASDARAARPLTGGPAESRGLTGARFTMDLHRPAQGATEWATRPLLGHSDPGFGATISPIAVVLITLVP